MTIITGAFVPVPTVVDNVRCDHCGVTVPLSPQFEMPQGWLSVRTADRLLAPHDFCGDECLAQSMAARVGKVLA